MTYIDTLEARLLEAERLLLDSPMNEHNARWYHQREWVARVCRFLDEHSLAEAQQAARRIEVEP